MGKSTPPNTASIFAPLTFAFTASSLQIDLKSFLNSATKIANSQHTLSQSIGYNGVIPYLDTTLEAEALGAKVSWSGDGYKVEASIEDYVPPTDQSMEEIQAKGRVPIALEVTRRLTATRMGQTKVISCVTGPVTVGEELWGTRFTNGLKTNDDSATGAFLGVGRALLNVARAYCEARPDVLLIYEKSGANIPEELFAEFLDPIIGVARYFGVSTILHQCRSAFPSVDRGSTAVDGVVGNLSGIKETLRDFNSDKIIGIAAPKEALVRDPVAVSERIVEVLSEFPGQVFFVTTDEELLGLPAGSLKLFISSLKEGKTI